jgi:hypothetical protein
VHVRSLLAGAGLAVVVAAVPIAVVSVASADDGGPPTAPAPAAPCPPGSRWEIAGDVAAAVDGSSDLSGLRDALAAAPEGTRAETAHQYLTDHPDTRAALRRLRQEVRPLVQQCRSGG